LFYSFIRSFMIMTFNKQLEQTVTKLQIAVGYTTEQVSALPPPLLKIRELEQDNARLQKENEELRRLLQPDSRTDATRRSGVATYQDPRSCDRDYNLKRRKAQDGVYIVSFILYRASYFILRVRVIIEPRRHPSPRQRSCNPGTTSADHSPARLPSLWGYKF